MTSFRSQAPRPTADGEFVFLYSSQSDQRSFEYPMADGSWHGEFTLRLAQTLRDAPDASWAQVLTATTEAMVQGPARQMPDGEGPLLDPSLRHRQAHRRFPVKDGKLMPLGSCKAWPRVRRSPSTPIPAGGEPLATLTLDDVTARDAQL
jgi:hypothetical protein